MCNAYFTDVQYKFWAGGVACLRSHSLGKNPSFEFQACSPFSERQQRGHSLALFWFLKVLTLCWGSQMITSSLRTLKPRDIKYRPRVSQHARDWALPPEGDSQYWLEGTIFAPAMGLTASWQLSVLRDGKPAATSAQLEEENGAILYLYAQWP